MIYLYMKIVKCWGCYVATRGTVASKSLRISVLAGKWQPHIHHLRALKLNQELHPPRNNLIKIRVDKIQTASAECVVKETKLLTIFWVSAVSYHKKSVRLGMTILIKVHWDDGQVYRFEVREICYEHKPETVRMDYYC